MKALLALASITLLSACAATHPIEPHLASTATDFADAQTVTVTLSNFRFTPQDIALVAGKPVILVLDDTATGGHDFTAPEFFAAATIAPHDAALVAAGQIALSGKQQVSLHLVPAAGDYKVVCTHFGHVALGMTGSIKVH